MSDTPEARAFTEREYRKELQAWNVLMGWWILCLLAGLGIVWGTGALGDGVELRIGITLFVCVGYALAIFMPMQIARPVQLHTAGKVRTARSGMRDTG